MKKGRPLLIILIAFALLVALSFIPLSRLTGGRVKDFSLFSDIAREIKIISGFGGQEQIDPELLAAMKKEEERKANHPLYATDSVLSQAIDTITSAPKPSRRSDGLVVIEDYTTAGLGLVQLRHALAQGRLARIAVVGDSYIEGDIFTQDLRENLQDTYGGDGVGFVSMHTDFPGFRRSVRQSGDGWKTFMANKKGINPDYIDLAEQYAVAQGVATAGYRGTDAFSHTREWAVSKFVYIAPDDCVISVKTSDNDWEDRNIEGGSDVRWIEIEGITDNFELRTASSSLVGLGVWLDGSVGVSVDCMSSRGFSGITLTKVSPELCRAMAPAIDYSLIILEFGINALSAQQTDYSVYSSRMVDVINHVRRCYPRADILVMGIGDRGVKNGGEIISMPTAQSMVTAQRNAARRAHCLFWDTREAMGGEGAVVEWSGNGLINKDYIHLTHKGGARLAGSLAAAIRASVADNPEAAPAQNDDAASTDNTSEE